jgi:quercetin dioxygenase-like cupin family protein
MKREKAELSKLAGRENPPGVLRTTLSYHDQSMLCHFLLRRGARIPLHQHEAVQHGYVLRGRVRFLLKDGSGFEAAAGSSYVFDRNLEHGAEALEESEVLDFFTPMRPEYADN